MCKQFDCLNSPGLSLLWTFDGHDSAAFENERQNCEFRSIRNNDNNEPFDEWFSSMVRCPAYWTNERNFFPIFMISDRLKCRPSARVHRLTLFRYDKVLHINPVRTTYTLFVTCARAHSVQSTANDILNADDSVSFQILKSECNARRGQWLSIDEFTYRSRCRFSCLRRSQPFRKYTIIMIIVSHVVSFIATRNRRNDAIYWQNIDKSKVVRPNDGTKRLFQMDLLWFVYVSSANGEGATKDGSEHCCRCPHPARPKINLLLCVTREHNHLR